MVLLYLCTFFSTVTFTQSCTSCITCMHMQTDAGIDSCLKPSEISLILQTSAIHCTCTCFWNWISLHIRIKIFILHDLVQLWNVCLWRRSIPRDLIICLCVKEEYLISFCWRTHQQPTVDPLDKFDPTKPYYEQYKVEFDQFKTLFLALSPWAHGQHADTLALRAFRVSVHTTRHTV